MNIHELLNALIQDLERYDLESNKFGFQFRFAIKSTLVACKKLKVFF